MFRSIEKNQRDPEDIWRHAFEGLRLGLLSGDESLYNENLFILLELQSRHKNLFPENPVAMLCGRPFQPGPFSSLPVQIQFYALRWILLDGLFFLQKTKTVEKYLQNEGFIYSLPDEIRPSFVYLLISSLLIKGKIAAAETWINKNLAQGPALGLRGWLYFLQEKNDEAIFCFEKDLEVIRGENQSEKAFFTGPEGLFYLLALLRTGDYKKHPQIKTIVAGFKEMQPHNPFLPAATLLTALIEVRENRLEQACSVVNAADLKQESSTITVLFRALVTYWMSGQPESSLLTGLRNHLAKAAAAEQIWLAHQYAQLLEVTDHETLRPATASKPEAVSLKNMISPEEQWQHALRALNSGADRHSPSIKSVLRLAWFLDCGERGIPRNLHLKIQRATADGRWSRGRPITLTRPCQPEIAELFNSQDQIILDLILRIKNKKEKPDIAANMPEIMLAMAGHPRIFLGEAPTTRVEVLQCEAELRVDRQEHTTRASFFPWPGTSPAVIIRENRARFRVYPINAKHRRIAGVVGQDGLNIQKGEETDLLATLGDSASFMTVRSSCGNTSLLPEINSDSGIVLQLTPYGEGLRISMLVRPFAEEGSCQKPGKGPGTIIAQSAGRMIQISRDLAQEEENALLVEELCPSLTMDNSSEREWLFPEPEECLQILHEIQGLPPEVSIEWPAGKRLAVSPAIGLEMFSLTIRKRNNWFEIGGALKIDETLLLDIRALIELASKKTSRFLPLGQGHFLTLSRQLRKSLDELLTFADLRKNAIRVHPLAGPTLRELAIGIGSFQADESWLRHQELFLKAISYEAKPPPALKNKLRDYQLSGFKWLARLAMMDAGACLADDMGLGKTIQALALIQTRAEAGPTLVVAPASVCFNWQEEAGRFAPALRVTMFGGRQRKEVLASLGPFDLLICSYGLMRQESELLSALIWQTIVLDEAQAIKNFLSKRSRAAMLLQGRFRMITTGTPIENHLGELWSLFEFINPGLLGSVSRFNKRFAIPIERDNNEEARSKLKKLLSPFIMRRKKAEVLPELPPRTEIILQVEMEEKEKALYAVLRQKALENLSQPEENTGKRSLRILAEIMKLRRACCHPRLALPDTNIPGAKLSLFAKLVTELRENGHRALVFSQFVDHLSIIRQYLDGEAIPYKYLDGSTPARKRQLRIKEFQAGEGDLFLISLKAGGLGLNLTAADYVIHLDPWWNPAVEDQASDRAHRLGQKRPVTIYRLVTRNSIEEKIVRLHKEKKDLADSLLAGNDRALDPEELLNILKET